MLSKFFLDRPVFAWVIAVIIMAAGGLAIYNLPISQYPPIAPPSIAISAFYAGASAETVENSVTQIIEQKMTGFDKLLYMSASSDSAGGSRLELTFAAGTDPDVAWSQVQNKLQLAMSSLPETVKSQGVTVSKSTRNYLMIVTLISEDGSMDGDDLRDYAQSNLEKILARVRGVGEVETFGSGYAMRIWLNPERLTDYHLTMEEVIAALRAYNVEVSAGQFGGAPAVEGQRLNASIVVQNMLRTPEEFASIPIRINRDGSIVRVRDVGRTELGTEYYDIQAFYQGKPASGLAIRQAAGANALDTADAVKAKMQEMSRFFPPGMKVVFPFDTTPFVTVAINEVVKTLIEAILLVFLIMWLFLGNVRATLIPTIAVPVVPRGHSQVYGTDHQRSDRHRAGALGRVRPHGVFPRLNGRHLSPVFRDHHRRHVALRCRGPDSDAGSLRRPSQTVGCRAWIRGNRCFFPQALFQMVRPHLLSDQRPVCASGRSFSVQKTAVPVRVPLDRGDHGLPLLSDAHLLPSG